MRLQQSYYVRPRCACVPTPQWRQMISSTGFYVPREEEAQTWKTRRIGTSRGTCASGGRVFACNLRASSSCTVSRLTSQRRHLRVRGKRRQPAEAPLGRTRDERDAVSNLAEARWRQSDPVRAPGWRRSDPRLSVLRFPNDRGLLCCPERRSGSGKVRPVRRLQRQLSFDAGTSALLGTYFWRTEG
jgi:hypothetical protein